MIKLLVGLGNPGPAYEDTRHNAGFWWVDEAARTLGAHLSPDKAYFGIVGRVNRPSGPVWLLQPQTFMNRSGQSVAALARFFKIEPSEILVAHDELDLPAGQLKLKRGGGHAGHNGLRDIQAQLGSADFWRLRLGVGHPGVKAEVADYVLRRPPSDERRAIEDGIQSTIVALDLLLDAQMDKAMAKLHPKPPKAPKPPQPSKATEGSESATHPSSPTTGST
jgi:peptidyl-tRNA hydrolase, PTH1 family